MEWSVAIINLGVVDDLRVVLHEQLSTTVWRSDSIIHRVACNEVDLVEFHIIVKV